MYYHKSNNMFREYKYKKRIEKLKKAVATSNLNRVFNMLKQNNDINMLNSEETLKLVKDSIKIGNSFDLTMLCAKLYKTRVYKTSNTGELTESAELGLKYLINNVDEDTIGLFISYNSISMINVYLLLDIKSPINPYKSYDSHGYINSNIFQSGDIPFDVMKKIKADMVDVNELTSFWNSFIPYEGTKKNCIKLMTLGELKESMTSSTNLVWDDSIIDYIKTDMVNIIKYTCILSKSPELNQVIDLIDSINCDNIKEYNLVLKIASCQSNDVLINILGKSNLSVEDQRAILLKNNTTCDVKSPTPRKIHW